MIVISANFCAEPLLAPLKIALQTVTLDEAVYRTSSKQMFQSFEQTFHQANPLLQTMPSLL